MNKRILLALAVCLSVAGSVHAQSANLDFEDGQEPDSHGWVPFPGEMSSTQTVLVGQNGPSAPGNHGLQIECSDICGWLLDLDSLPGFDPQRDLILRADVKNNGININGTTLGIRIRAGGIRQAGVSIGSPPSTVDINDGQWHTLELRYGHGPMQFQAFVDGTPVQPSIEDASDDMHPAMNGTTNGIAFGYGNTGSPEVALVWDNVLFSTAAPAPALRVSALATLIAGFGIGGSLLLRHNRSRRQSLENSNEGRL